MAVYIGARDLSGFPLGTHQFIVITFPNPVALMVGDQVFATKILGPRLNGIVIGAHDRGTLNVEVFERGDTIAAKEFFGGSKASWSKWDYDAELRVVKFNGADFSLHGERKLISLVSAYLINQTLDPISYPTGGIGFNSNSWVQSAIEYSGGKVNGNMKGLDIYHKKRIPETYFLPFCPPNPRIKLNQ